MGRPIKDLTDKKFGELTVSGYAYTDRTVYWICKCACGSDNTIVRGSALTSGNTKSCGCLRGYMHGMTGTRTYRAWDNMIQRATNPNFTGSKYYLGRGIKIEDPRWFKFENFLKDLGERPEGLTLDRIDNEDGYYKENCRWTTHKIQQNNKRSRGTDE